MYREAISYYEKALALSTRSVSTYAGLAYTYHLQVSKIIFLFVVYYPQSCNMMCYWFIVLWENPNVLHFCSFCGMSCLGNMDLWFHSVNNLCWLLSKKVGVGKGMITLDFYWFFVISERNRVSVNHFLYLSRKSDFCFLQIKFFICSLLFQIFHSGVVLLEL